MEEKWKTIEWNPNYQVSNLGRVKSIERKEKCKNFYRIRKEKILIPEKTIGGYLRVNLWEDGKMKHFSVHRLVASAFVQNNSLFNTEINHLDENKENNCASNLEWCEHIHNINFGTRNERAGIAISKALTGIYNTKKSKSIMCIETSKIYPSLSEVQRQFGFSQSNICNCCRGKRNTCGGYHWKYVE